MIFTLFLRIKDPLLYGAAYLFWGIFGYVEAASYYFTIKLALIIFLITSLMTILLIGS